MATTDIHVKDNSELFRLLDKVDKHIDGLSSQVRDLQVKVEAGESTVTETKESLTEAITRLNSAEESWRGVRSRMEIMDALQEERGTKIYLPTGTRHAKSPLRQEFARFLLDGMSMAVNRKARFGSEHFKRLDPNSFDGTQGAIGQTVKDNAEGGYLVPDEFKQEILRIKESYGFVRRNFRTIPIQRNQMHLPTHLTGPEVGWYDEAQGPSQDDAVTFGRITLTTKRLMAVDTLSIEILEESIPLITDFLIEVFGEKIAQEEDRVGLKGDVTANPTTDPFDGVLADAGNLVYMGGAANSGQTAFGDISYEDLVNTMDAVNEFVADESVWAASNHLINLIRKIRSGTYDASTKYTDVGMPMWTEMAMGNPPSILGRPYIRTASMPKAADSGVGKVALVYGSFRNAFLADRMNTSVAFSDHVDFKNGNVTMRVMERIGFKVALPDAFAVLSTATS